MSLSTAMITVYPKIFAVCIFHGYSPIQDFHVFRTLASVTGYKEYIVHRQSLPSSI